MYFNTKNTLKNNRNHILKPTLKYRPCTFFFLVLEMVHFYVSWVIIIMMWEEEKKRGDIKMIFIRTN